MSDELVEALVAATGDAELAGATAVVRLTDGKAERATISVVDGRVVGAADGEADVAIPLGEPSLEPWLAGETDLAVAYMRGDCKPEGSTRALLVGLAVLDRDATRDALRDLL